MKNTLRKSGARKDRAQKGRAQKSGARTGRMRNSRAKRKFIFFLCLAAALVLFAIVAPYLTPNDPNTTDYNAIAQGPSAQYPFGTDLYGRCVLSRCMVGARTSIFAAVALVAVSFVVGTTLGMLSGWFGGVLDAVVMRIADLFLAFPQMVLAIAVAGVLGGSLLNAMLALGITGWTQYARLARSHTLSVKKEPYIIAARLNGTGNFKILFRHVLPNISGPLAVNAVTQLGTNMIGISGLSFLGLGVVPPQAEWGSMISESRAYLTLAPWSVFAPAAAIVITVMVFNCLGDAFRDLNDVSEVRA